MKLTLLTSLCSTISLVSASVRGRAGRKLTTTDACVNTEPWARQDQGCDSLYPICALDTGYDPVANAAGSSCAKCINTIDSEDVLSDLGCEGEYSQCNADLGKAGNSCYKPATSAFVCENTASYGSIDNGCSAETPICIDSNTGKEIASGLQGDKCVACIKVFGEDNYATGQGDYGCSDPLNYPRCMTAEATDPAEWSVGAQCCQADGTCAPACPCNEPGSVWETTMLAHHPLSVQGCSFQSGQTAGIQFEGLGLWADMKYGGTPTCVSLNMRKEITAAEALSCYNDIMSIAHTHYSSLASCSLPEW